jgi:hypothetical protein
VAENNDKPESALCRDPSNASMKQQHQPRMKNARRLSYPSESQPCLKNLFLTAHSYSVIIPYIKKICNQILFI